MRFQMESRLSGTRNKLKHLLQRRIETPRALCFCVKEIDSDKPIGVCNLINNFPEHLKIELGGIWYGPQAQGTGANTEAVYLMLRHVFNLGYRLVEWKCDNLNQKSKHVAQKLGFKPESIQESLMIIKGYNRDTAWFRLFGFRMARNKS